MIPYLKLDDRLAVLRAEDSFRTWHSLDDERLCIVCKRKFTGRQVEIRRMAGAKYELHCPTDHCNSRPHLWVYPRTPLVCRVAKSDWWRAVGRKEEQRAFNFPLRARGHRV